MTPTDDELNLAAAKLLGVPIYNGRPIKLPPFPANEPVTATIETLPFSPATDIADAMRVVEHLRKQGIGFEICCDDKRWAVWVMSTEGAKADDPSLPRALTLAAVRAAATPGEKGSA